MHLFSSLSIPSPHTSLTIHVIRNYNCSPIHYQRSPKGGLTPNCTWKNSSEALSPMSSAALGKFLNLLCAFVSSSVNEDDRTAHHPVGCVASMNKYTETT